MSDINIILWWMVLGGVIIVSSILLMALIGVVKRREDVKFFSFLTSVRKGFDEVTKESIDEFGVSGAIANALLSSLLWPISVYFILTGKYSWN